MDGSSCMMGTIDHTITVLIAVIAVGEREIWLWERE